MRPPIRPRHFGPLIVAADRILRATSRWSVEDPAGTLERLATGRPAILACRHGQLWPLLWTVSALDVSIVVSRSEDGELLARVLRSMGFGLVRGSTSRDAAEAARGVLRVLRSGGCIGVAVDGPRGPRGLVQDGVLRLAQRAEVPVVPLRCEGDGFWVAPGSWDRFEIPRPGGRLVVRVGEPVFVGRTEGALVAAGERIARSLGGWRPESVAAEARGWSAASAGET